MSSDGSGAPRSGSGTLESLIKELEKSDSRTSAETPVARATEPPPTRSGAGPRIEDDGVIGRGGMGEIHRVYDRNIRRYAALKVLDTHLATQPDARRRFLAEAQITGQLEHPNIVPVYDLQLADNGAPVHFTMKLVDGATLSQFIGPERVAGRSEAELWELLSAFLKVCDAVAYANSRGVVHRDLKPDNVMIGSYGQVYVMDWGIARTVGPGGSDAPTTSSPAPSSEPESSLFAPPASMVPVRIDVKEELDEGSIVGTYQYMAPEQAWGRIHEIDARTDVFALGGMLYHILTGRSPYGTNLLPKEAVMLAREARIVPPGDAVEGISPSPALSAIAMRALQPEREKRYQSVDALKRDVERALRGGLSLGTKVFRAGTVILREGDPPDAAYIVTAGRCEAYRSGGPEGRGESERTTLREMGPGDVFGEMALLSSRPRSASVVAIDDVTAIVVSPEALAREVHAESWLVPLLKTLVERFRDLEERTRR